MPGFCKSATLDEVRKHGHVLTPGRYVGAEAAEDDGESFDEKMTRLVATAARAAGRGREAGRRDRREPEGTWLWRVSGVEVGCRGHCRRSIAMGTFGAESTADSCHGRASRSRAANADRRRRFNSDASDTSTEADRPTPEEGHASPGDSVFTHRGTRPVG